MKINLIEYFENTIKKYADKVAVWDKERYATFAELEEANSCLSE